MVVFKYISIDNIICKNAMINAYFLFDCITLEFMSGLGSLKNLMTKPHKKSPNA